MADAGKNPPGKPPAGSPSTLASPGARASGKMPAAPASVRPGAKSTAMRAAPKAKPPESDLAPSGRETAKEAVKPPNAADVKPLPLPPADLSASLLGTEREELPREIGARIMGTPLDDGSGKVHAVAISIPPDPRAPPQIRETHGSIRPEGAASLVGAVVGGRYRIEALLGEGAMGAVFLAEHRLMRKKVALKVLHPQWSTVPDIVGRFEREAMAASRIEHPNVAAATDFGQLEDGAFFLVLEFVEGRTLRQEIALDSFSVPRTLHVLRQIASALVKAHGLGIVHRDLKPENVMLLERAGQEDFVKVLDFGIAKITAGDLERVSGPKTEVGMVYGTPEYMAPEQAMGLDIDGRADLYALGVVAFELLTGLRPFHAENKLALLGMHVHADVPSMSDKNPAAAIPPLVERFVARLLAKKPADRFADAKALLNAVDDLAEELLRLGLYTENEIRAIGSARDLRSPRAIALGSGEMLGNGEFAATEVVPSEPVPMTEFLARHPAPEYADDEVVELVPRRRFPRPTMIASAAAFVGAVCTVLALQMARSGSTAEPGPDAHVADPAIARSTYLVERTLPAPAPMPRPSTDTAPSPLPAAVPTPSALAPALPVPPPAAAPLQAVQTPSMDPDSALRKSQEFLSAGQPKRAIAVLEDALVGHPKHPALSLALFKAQLGGASRGGALHAAYTWLESDPSAASGAAPQLMALVDDAIASNEGLDDAFRLLEDRLGARGGDKLYDLAYGPAAKDHPQLAARARTGLQFASALTKATPGLRIALQLRQAQGCEEVSALLKRVRDVGDERCASLLHTYEKTDGCRGADCYACLRATSELSAAIIASERRPASR